MGLGQGQGRDYLMTSDAQWAFDAYEAVRARLPETTYPTESRHVESLGDLTGDFDVFLLDAFGVLNIGESAIPGAPESIAALQKSGAYVAVVSNAAGYPKRLLLDRYTRLGFNIAPENILTSREVLLAALKTRPRRKWGLMASQAFGMEELEHLGAVFLEEDPQIYDDVEEFLFFGSAEWTKERQSLLEASLTKNPRPVLVGNPDIVAPREGGLSREPGYFAHSLADRTGVEPQFFGKPFGNAFDMALAKVSGVEKSRMVMVGDTLHTDILGGQAAGVATALIAGHGALKGMDANDAIKRSAIVPHFIMLNP